MIRPSALKTAFAIALAGAFFVSVSGCSLLSSAGAASTVEPTGIAVVVGNRANSAIPDLTAITAVIPSSLGVGSVLTVTGISGLVSGETGGSQTVIDLGNSSDNAAQALTARANIIKEVGQVTASVPEADDLGAIASAARSIAQVKGVRIVIIADSMLSTAGVLQFQNGLFAHAATDIAVKIPANQLPDLHGSEVIIIGQGKTKLPQPALGTGDLLSLRSAWEKILKHSGAASIHYVDSVTVTGVAPVTPQVTVVAPSEVIPVSFPSPCSAIAPTGALNFGVNTAVFVNPEKAKYEIHNIADKFKLEKCTGKIRVDGTASSEGNADRNIALSMQRAEAVAKILSTDLGIPTSSMDIRGLGSDFPEFVKDTDESGALIAGAAELNRTVRISFSD
jgi:hypothetical protein